jgi:hypothetical protein
MSIRYLAFRIWQQKTIAINFKPIAIVKVY